MKNSLKHIITSMGFSFLCYYPPQFVLKNTKELSLEILISILGSVLVLHNQGPIKPQKKMKDKGSALIILSITFLSQMLASAENAIQQSLNENVTAMGLSLVFLGLYIRIWSVLILGSNFNTHILQKEEGKLITVGLYKIIRHPSYLGAYMFFVGNCLMLNSYYSLIASLILLFFAYNYRIKIEEKELISYFKQEYIKYKNESWCMIPYLY